MPNKEIEKLTLNLLYRDFDFLKILDHEEPPDFILYNEKSKHHFGVEITELFYNETNARLDKILDYSDQLIDYRIFKHKDDKLNLNVDTIKLMDPEGNLKAETVAIIQKIPSYLEYLRILQNRILNKEEKVFNYLKKDILYVNLIISDQESLFNMEQIDEVFTVFMTDEFSNITLNSTFREIFFITKVNKTKVCYFLKSQYFIGEFSIIYEFCTKHKYDFEKFPNFLKFFFHYCSLKGFQNIFYETNNEKTNLYYADSVIKVENNNITVERCFEENYCHLHNYNDFIKNYTPDEWLLQEYLEYRKGKVFKSNWVQTFI